MSQSASVAPKVAPHFVVAIINDDIVLRVLISSGASVIASEVAELTRTEGTASVAILRCMLYSPNLVVDDYPQFAWDADLEVENVSYFVGTVAQRCDVIHTRWTIPTGARRIRLRLHRMRQAPIRSRDSDQLARKLIFLFQSHDFNPRSGSLPLQTVAEEAQKRFPVEYRRAVGGDHLGSFRNFLAAHSDSFAIFRYREKDTVPALSSDERVTIQKEVRDSYPPMLPPGHPNEASIIELLKGALQNQDSHIHRLVRQLSGNDSFRIGMSAAFSTLMHVLQRHRGIFRWTTDPQHTCTIGLVPGATLASLNTPFSSNTKNKIESLDSGGTSSSDESF